MIKAFQTDSGIIVPAVTTDQMREVDRIAMEETGPNLYQMMENAGRTLAEVALGTLAAAPSEAVVVLAGPGGNGGGGICAARHLANRGVDVRLCLSRPDNLDPTTAFQQKVYRSASTGREVRLNELEHQHPALILDALIGYGLQGPPRGLAADLLRWANGSGSRILSLDFPSGLESTTGETPGEFIRPST
jgi:NAD(P)H-hydrate epimerase